ncbi:MAG: O-antigen ligase family protein [Candidatus Saccharimonadales bacterium]
MSNTHAAYLLPDARFSRFCVSMSLVLAACLPLLVPFQGASRNIDLQGLILIIAGGFAWLAVLLRYRARRRVPRAAHVVLLAVFMACCLISLVLDPHKNYDLLGAPYIRLGTLGLLACVGCGLVTARFSAVTLTKYLYLGTTGMALVSVPCSLLRFHSLTRIGGVFAQADVFACFLGCGLLLGLHMSRQYPRRRYLLLGNQLFLVSLLLLTQTRAIIVAVALLSLAWSVQHRASKTARRLPVYMIGLLLVFFGLYHFAPGRLTNAGYASESLDYRWQLQASALRASKERPLFGYGPGNLADALACEKLSDKPLRTTCHEGYFFNSSHNIFIDRMLGIGWLGGLSYLLLVGLAAYKGLRGQKETRILGYVIILIGLYYLTNVTSVTLELLLWIVMLRCLTLASPSRA